MNTIIEKAPQEWKTVSFKELAKERSVRVDNPGESGYEIYVGLEHLDSGSLIVKRHGSTKDVTSSMKLFKKGDILFARRNTYLKRCSVATFDGVCSGDIIVLQPILSHIVEGFLPILMQFEPLENRIISLSAGAFSKRIKWRQLAAEKIPIPSKEEQQKIVEAVWSIQDNIQKTEKLIETTEKLKQGLLNELLTKGIGHTRFKDSELGKIPGEWKVRKISDITEYVSYGFTNPMPTTDEGPFMITAANINKGKIQYDSARHTLYTAYKELTPKSKPIIDDILLTKDGTLGKVAIVDRNDICINQSVACMRLKKESINLNFFVQMLQSPYIQKRMLSDSSGSTIKHIYITKFSKMVVPIPSKEEQQSIVQILEKIETELEKQNIHIEKLSELKNKLTNELFSGKLKVPLSSSNILIKALI